MTLLTPMFWWWLVVLIMAVIGFAVDLGYLVRNWKKKDRRFRWIISASVMCSLVALMLVILLGAGVRFYYVRTGFYTAVLLIAVVCLHMIDSMTCSCGKDMNDSDSGKP